MTQQPLPKKFPQQRQAKPQYVDVWHIVFFLIKPWAHDGLKMFLTHIMILRSELDQVKDENHSEFPIR